MRDERLAVARNAAAWALFGDEGGTLTIVELGPEKIALAQKVAERVVDHLARYDAGDR